MQGLCSTPAALRHSSASSIERNHPYIVSQPRSGCRTVATHVTSHHPWVAVDSALRSKQDDRHA
ncbi:hypothetical protein SCLCIDRAFT_1208063, partial [Scleroderma citrinum Foug A]